MGIRASPVPPTRFRVLAAVNGAAASAGMHEEGNPAGLSSCSGGLRPPVELCVQPWALSLPDKELCLREALAVCTAPAPEPSAKRPGS